MFDKVWDWFEKKEWSRIWKERLFLTCLEVFFGLLGVILWLLLKGWFPGFDILVCLVGYLGFFAGYVGGMLYLYRHEFS